MGAQVTITTTTTITIGDIQMGILTVIRMDILMVIHMDMAPILDMVTTPLIPHITLIRTPTPSITALLGLTETAFTTTRVVTIGDAIN
jgi:hypothetical protein